MRRVRLDEAEPDHIYRDGAIRYQSITRDGRSVGVARHYGHGYGWHATLWARPGKIRARTRLGLLWRVARELRKPPPAWWPQA